jgi:hypothetical protein
MDKIKILGLGHPRTGTGFTSKTLKTFGLNVGHETLESDGIVAWQLVAKEGPWPWMAHFDSLTKERPDFDYLIYNVRNPKDSIPSIIQTDDHKTYKGTSSLNYRIHKIGAPHSFNRVEQAILSIITFDKIITNLNPDVIYRIEDQYDKLYEFAKYLNPSISYVEPEKKVNSRPHDGLSGIQKDLEGVRPFYKILINEYCDKYGYPRMFDHDQELLKRNESKGLKVSVIMMSYLGDYPGSRSNPVPKFNRAIKSFLNQSYQNTELIIVSDGCELTNSEYEKNWKNNPKIKLVKTDKADKMWPGKKRQIGIDQSTGDWIAYLDSDDMYHPDHIKNIVNSIDENSEALMNRAYAELKKIIEPRQFKMKHNKMVIMDERNRWVYLDSAMKSSDYEYYFLDGKIYMYSVRPNKYERHGTSRIFHKKDIPVKWEDRDARGEDIIFSNAIMEQLKYKKIDQGTYIVCHVPEGMHKFDM